MLVLSRRESERILFPQLGISVEVVKVGGTAARIGIEAPQNVRVLREEVAGTADELTPNGAEDACVRQELRNCLDRFCRQLDDLLERCDPETGDSVESMLDEIEYRIRELDAGEVVAEPNAAYRVVAPERMTGAGKKSKPKKKSSEPVRSCIPFVTNVPSLPC